MDNIRAIENEIRGKVEKYGLEKHWLCSSIGNYPIDELMNNIFSEGYFFPDGNYIHKTDRVVNDVIGEIREYLKIFEDNEELWNKLRSRRNP